MGSPKEEEEGSKSEGPQHVVQLGEFLMGRTPITQAQWRTVAQWEPREGERWGRELKPNPSGFQHHEAQLLNNETSTDARPVERVSWYDAMEFCSRLSQRTGKTYRLPSEAQWEYACRAGTTTPFAFGYMMHPRLANYNSTYTYGQEGNSEYREQTTPVGMFPANVWGLHDMHGNVWEWCLDHWHESYEGAPEDGSAWLAEEGETRLLRGGSWFFNPRYCRSATRVHYLPGLALNYIGFRVVCLSQMTSELMPPNHLVDLWAKDWEEIFPDQCLSLERYIATKAADWQLAADVEWVDAYAGCGKQLRDRMRPKPKSLAEIAIDEWKTLRGDIFSHMGQEISKDNIGAALERLKELEDQQ